MTTLFRVRKVLLVHSGARQVHSLLLILGFGLGTFAGVRAEVTVRSDVPFLADDREEKLDVYLPPAWTPGDRRPAVVWIHGGGWLGGDKAARREVAVCREFATMGFVAVSVNYQLGAGAWPGNLGDCRDAVRYLRTTANVWGVDPERIA